MFQGDFGTLKQTLTHLLEKSLGDFQGSNLEEFLFLLRRNINPSADFMWQCHPFLPLLYRNYAFLFYYFFFFNKTVNKKIRYIKINLLELRESEDFEPIPIIQTKVVEN